MPMVAVRSDMMALKAPNRSKKVDPVELNLYCAPIKSAMPPWVNTTPTVSISRPEIVKVV
ncbi:hypothetical protein D3C76_949710 [compost metagenome]